MQHKDASCYTFACSKGDSKKEQASNMNSGSLSEPQDPINWDHNGHGERTWNILQYLQ